MYLSEYYKYRNKDTVLMLDSDVTSITYSNKTISLSPLRKHQLIDNQLFLPFILPPEAMNT